ncbi:hypothetical protein ACJQWK_00219 [Exserohilum turcicum]|uniref:Uncharacterized protein n=1 Tax=Exserohilum turcicum (strain 28A) TaxID=671987 RepID=R0IEJ5_EXST2|nr:uncharacterized protein SETTUDRAFT_22233 [Exserohilum turcica Et28A]EOA83536.1 hypothetical protein SETTUDRAFT_22233 [Exserohilum turcica Et28A]
MGSPLEHWLVAHRRKEATRANSGTNADPPIANNPVPGRIWTKESLAKIWGYSSLKDMCGRANETPWYNAETGMNEEVDESSERTLTKPEGYNPFKFRLGPSLVPGLPPGWFAAYRAIEQGLGQGSDEDAIALLASLPPRPPPQPLPPLRVPRSSLYIENQILILHQDLDSLFEHYLTKYVSASCENEAFKLLHAEMDVLMAHHEVNLAHSDSDSTLLDLYAGFSERIQQSIIYCAYIAWDQEQFPSRPRAGNPWGYLLPKTYMAKALSRQRISSEMLVVFQNKQSLLRELRTVTWGRRAYLDRLEQLSDADARTLWMLHPTFTHSKTVPLHALVGNLQRLYLQMGDRRLLRSYWAK